MRIVIAAWHLKNFNVGIGRYTRCLIEAIGQVDRENEYEVLMPDDVWQFPPYPNMRYRVIRFPVFKRRFWEQVAPLLAGPYDLLHFPYDSCVAWKRGKFVTTIHDVKPLVFDGGQGRPVMQRLEQAVVGDRIEKIDHVLTDSEWSRRDIMTLLKMPEERITVVYPGIDLHQFSPGHERTGGERPHPYVLCVAGSDPTKNVGTLVEAFARLPGPLREAHDLVLTGDFRRRPDLLERVRGLGIERQTVFSGVVSDERLIELYRGAAVFVFPSRYEGFGLPVLEAMACGCPTISSNASSLPEVAGEGAILVDPMDIHGFARAIERVLTDEAWSQSLRERGFKQAAGFPWTRTARETVAVYRAVCGC